MSLEATRASGEKVDDAPRCLPHRRPVHDSQLPCVSNYYAWPCIPTHISAAPCPTFWLLIPQRHKKHARLTEVGHRFNQEDLHRLHTPVVHPAYRWKLELTRKQRCQLLKYGLCTYTPRTFFVEDASNCNWVFFVLRDFQIVSPFLEPFFNGL